MPMMLRKMGKAQEVRRLMEEQMGLKPKGSQFLRDLLDIALPVTAGPIGMIEAMTAPSQEESKPPGDLDELRRWQMRAANPLSAIYGLIADNPAVAATLAPVMLGRPATAAQKTFKGKAKTLRGKLKGSRVADVGKPKRVYHGTPYGFEKFEVRKNIHGGGGGDLYGPGIYFTENIAVAGGDPKSITGAIKDNDYFSTGYATGNVAHPIRATETAENAWSDIQKAKRYVKELTDEFKGERMPAAVRNMIDDQKRIIERRTKVLENIEKRGGAPNVQPVFLDIKNPFDDEVGVDSNKVWKAAAETVEAWGGRGKNANANAETILDMAIEMPLGQKVHYDDLAQAVGKEQATQWIKRMGFDGITHMGGPSAEGKMHRVWIAFDPEQVIPAFAEGAPTVTRVTAAERARQLRIEAINKLKDVGEGKLRIMGE